jgi:hypothetical protein
MRTVYRTGHYDGGIAVVRRVLPTKFGWIAPPLDNQPGLLLSPSGIRLFFLTRIATSLSGTSCSVGLLTNLSPFVYLAAITSASSCRSFMT